MSDSKSLIQQLVEENRVLKNQLTILENLSKEKEVTDEALKNLEERFNVLYKSAPDAIFLLDFEGNFIDVNNVVTEKLGFPEVELVGKNVFEMNLFPSEEFGKLEKAFEANLKGLNFGPETIVLQNSKGNDLFAEISSFPIVLNGKNVILGIGRDITERKKSERILMENEQLFSLHVNQTPLGVIEWDLNFKVKKWNPAAENIFGYPAAEAIGKHANFIVLPEHRALIEGVMNDLVAKKGGRRSTNQNVRKNGEIINCEWYNTPLVNDEGVVIALASLVLDISEQVRSEQVQKVLYNISNAVNTSNNLQNLIAFIQAEIGKIIDTKNFFVALYDEKTETMSLPFFVDEKDKFTNIPARKTLTGYVIKTRRSLLAGPEVLKKLEDLEEIENVGTNCKIWMGVPLNIDGKVVGVLAVQSYTNEQAFSLAEMKMLEFVSDQISISIHRKKAEEDLIKALHKAEESDRLKTAFLQNVSHEIRTPMNGILGFTTLLKTPDLGSSEKSEFIQIIEKSGKRMLNTINDLMDISKIESGQMEVGITEINVNQQIRELYEFFKPEAEGKGLLLSVDKTLSDSEAKLNSDYNKVYAILTNLIKNSIKYTHDGTVEFGYTKTNNLFEFYVKDTGIGIPEGKIASVFDRFIRVDQSTSGEYEGTGLGLAITKAFVEMLGGTICLESEVGKGSVFHFTVPNQSEVDKKEIVNELKPRIENNRVVKELKILVAEDNETIRTYLKMATREICREILYAKNGIETVDLMRENPDIELILMDIKMPGMDGYETTREIRKFNKEVVIIAQTAFDLETVEEKILDAGCNGYLPKPIKRHELIETIEKYFAY